MRYDAASLAELCRTVGWPRGPVPEAVASALVTSGGIPGYHFTIGSPGSGDLRGLWGLDVDAYPVYADVDLWVPAIAAEVALELYEYHDGMDWCAAYRTGKYRALLDHAATEATRTGNRPPMSSPVTILATGDRIAHALHTVRQTLRPPMTPPPPRSR